MRRAHLEEIESIKQVRQPTNLIFIQAYGICIRWLMMGRQSIRRV